MQIPAPTTKSTWVRVAAVAAGSLVAFWVVYQILLRVFPDNGHLSEFGVLTAGMFASFWASTYFSWLSTGNFLPHSTESAPAQSQSSTIRVGFLGSPLTVTLLSVAWLTIWFYVNLLHNSFRASLLDGTALDIALSNDEALRISKSLGGLLSFGITFPLLAASAFIAGWACSSPLRFRPMLIPATAYFVIAAVLNYGPEILHTGRPPLYEVMTLLLRKPEWQPTSAELGFLWVVNLAVFPLGPLAFAAFGRLWTYIGFSLRSAVARNEL